MDPNLSSKIHLQGDLIPDNNNPRQPVTAVKYIKGATQPFQTLQELLDFHPAKMETGMSVRVVSIDLVSAKVVVDEYVLMVDPATLLDASNQSIVTSENFLTFWARANQTLTQAERVFAYSPDGPNGTKPPFPYQEHPAFESNWHPTALPTDRWVRFRDSDDFVEVSGVKIYLGWTVPISVGQQDINGDYIDYLYLRQDVDTTIRTGLTGLVNLLYYQVLVGTVTETVAATGQDVVHTSGRVFQYLAANSYIFSVDCEMRETVPAPPRTVNGLSNNFPSGWEDVPDPDDDEQLWRIHAAKSVYGDLKSEWQITKIDENPDLIRYSEFASPNPNTLVGTNDEATTGSDGDTLLNDNGWEAKYKESHKFTAEREETGSSPAYTEWSIKRISGESGEYVERVFKLFDINADFDDVATQKPTSSDAISEGFFDTPQEETDTQINYVFEARKFFDGTLKGAWSNGVPYTGREIFNDVISADPSDSFKYNPNSATPDDPDPAFIVLTAQLYKGLKRVWETSEVQYEWRRLYNNGSAEDTLLDSFTDTDPLYLLPADGVEGTEGYLREAQRLHVTPDGVSGKAIFQCKQTFIIPDGVNLEFIELFSVNDVTDGLDAKDLSIKADAQLVIFDNVAIAFAPSEVNLNAFFTNLVDPVIRWFRNVGGTWVELEAGDSGTPEFTITETPFGSRLTVDCASLFDADDDLEEVRLAATTHGTNPDLADSITTFSDYTTITKAAAAAVGTPGENASFGILDNEYQNIILDDDTLEPFPDEIGAAGKAATILSVFNGVTLIPYGAGAGKFTISLSSDTVDATFASNTVGLTNEVRIYVNTWAAGLRKASCTIEINYDTGTENIIFTKKFTVGSTLDTPGALQVIIDSDKGFEFYVADRTTKTLTARVYDSSEAPPLQASSGYYFNWTVGGVTDVSYVQGGGGTNGEIKTLTRAQVLLSAFVTVRISKVAAPTSADILRSVTIRINDVSDGRLYRLFSNASVAPTKPNSSVGPAGNGTWVPFVANARWAVDGYENANTNPPTYTWSDPYQVGGEDGDQGHSGGFYMELFRSTVGATPPPGFGAGGNLSTIAQMVAAGWRSSTPGQFPTSGYIWITKRLYKTTNSGGGELAFDANGYPINEVVYSANSVWLAPQKITPDAPTTGGQGHAGWSQILANVVRDASSVVQQLVGWTGGGGSPPGGVGMYLGPDGLTANINAATNIKGNTGVAGADGLGQVVYENSGTTSAGANINLTFADLGIGKFLMIFEISAQDSTAAGAFGMTRQVWPGKTLAFDYSVNVLNVYGDGFSPTNRPILFCSRSIYVNATAGFDRILIQAAGLTEGGGYSSPSYKVTIIKLKA